jgi:Protein of unknown function (DUF3443)
MSARLRVRTVVATVLAVAGIAASGSVGGAGATAASASADGRAVIPVTISGGQGTRAGARPMVEVRVGTSAPVPLLLDTGSTGLQIFTAVVDTTRGSGVTVTDQPDQITYSGGHRLTGVVADAKVTIGSQTTAHTVAFGLVQQAVCIPSKPTCPVAGGIAAAMARGFYGILGIGMNHGPNGLASPILGMRADLARSWSLHLSGASGSLVLGALLPHSSPDDFTIPLVSTGTVGTYRFWNDRPHFCVVVGTVGSCAPALFDSGTYAFQLSQVRWPNVPVYTGTSVVVAGNPVTVFVVGNSTPMWKFTTGLTKSADLVTLAPNLIVNTGVQAYYAFTITYDDVDGVIGLVGARTAQMAPTQASNRSIAAAVGPTSASVGSSRSSATQTVVTGSCQRGRMRSQTRAPNTRLDV